MTAITACGLWSGRRGELQKMLWYKRTNNNKTPVTHHKRPQDTSPCEEST
jgi:hypothetical protein